MIPQRILAGVCLVLYIVGWGDEVLKNNFGLQDAPFLFVCLIYLGLTLIPSRYKEVALGSSIGLISGSLYSLYLTKIGIIFLVVKPSPFRTLFYDANLLFLGTGIVTWVACYRSLEHIKLLIALFASWMLISLALQTLRFL